MSESAIEEIYTAIAKMDLGGVKCRNIDKVKLTVRAGDLPMRLLIPSVAGETTFIAIGSLNNVAWTIRDLCLWAPMASGGIQKYASPMLKYIKAYVEALKSLRNPTNQSTIIEHSEQMTPMPWADSDYWAVDCTIIVEEIL